MENLEIEQRYLEVKSAIGSRSYQSRFWKNRLLDAIMAEDIPLARACLQDHPPEEGVDSILSRGKSGIHLICALGNIDLLRLWFEHGSQHINVSDSFGSRPIHIATQAKYLEMVSFLMERGADPKNRNASGQTVLTIAIQTRDPVMISYWIKHATEIELYRHNVGFDDLIAGIQLRHLGLVQFCVYHLQKYDKFNVQPPYTTRLAPLEEAIRTYSIPIIASLLRADAIIENRILSSNQIGIFKICSHRLDIIDLVLASSTLCLKNIMTEGERIAHRFAIYFEPSLVSRLLVAL